MAREKRENERERKRGGGAGGEKVYLIERLSDRERSREPQCERPKEQCERAREREAERERFVTRAIPQ